MVDFVANYLESDIQNYSVGNRVQPGYLKELLPKVIKHISSFIEIHTNATPIKLKLISRTGVL